MQQSYAVIWVGPSGEISTGKLTLGDRAAVFDGVSTRFVQYAEIERLRNGRGVAERLQGRPSLVLDLVGRGLLHLGSVDAPGSLHEIAELLDARRLEQAA